MLFVVQTRLALGILLPLSLPEKLGLQVYITKPGSKMSVLVKRWDNDIECGG